MKEMEEGNKKNEVGVRGENRAKLRIKSERGNVKERARENEKKGGERYKRQKEIGKGGKG